MPPRRTPRPLAPPASPAEKLRGLDRWLGSFFPYQLRWLLDARPFVLGLKSRQIGFSHATAGGAVKSAFFDQRPQLILSASEDLSAEVLAKARAHCEILAALGWSKAVDFAVDSTTELAWKSGGRIVALPANPRTARSFSGDIWLDEFHYHLDPQGIRDGAFAMATLGNRRIRIFSTPNGAQGLFYDWCLTPPPGWGLHTVTVDDAMAEGLPVDLEKLWQLAGGDERIFAQWYRCAWLDADLQYVPTAIADRALGWIGRMPSLEGVSIHAGLDVGRTQDLTVLTLIAVVGRYAYVIAQLTCRRSAFKVQRRMLDQTRAVLPWQTLHVDETGMGKQFAEELVEAWGDDEVRPVTFTTESKADLATRTMRWLRDGRIRFPKDETGKALRDDVIAVRRTVSKHGNILYEVPRSSKGHGDRWWSLALALKGAGEPVQPRGMGQEPLLAVA